MKQARKMRTQRKSAAEKLTEQRAERVAKAFDKDANELSTQGHKTYVLSQYYE